MNFKFYINKLKSKLKPYHNLQSTFNLKNSITELMFELIFQ